MKVLAVMSFGDLPLKDIPVIPEVGDTVILRDGNFVVAKRLFSYNGSLNWYGQIRREWVCRLMFEGLP